MTFPPSSGKSGTSDLCLLFHPCLCRGFGWISMIFFMKKKIEMKVVIKINVTCVILILLGKLFVHFTPAAPSSEYFNPVYPLPLILFYK